MATLTQSDKAEIAAEIRVLASWVTGPRRVKALALAERVEGADPDEALATATELARDKATEKPQLGQDAVPGKVVNDDKATDDAGNPVSEDQQ